MIWWVLTLLYNSRAWTTLYTLAWTNRDAHLFMAWANYKPARHKVYKNVRGVQVHCGYRWIWDTPHIAEQNESGDTYTHTFKLAALRPTDHIWYYLFSLAPDLSRQCQGPLIHIQPPEIPMPSARIFHSVSQPAPAPAITILTYDSVLWDDGGFYDPAQPTRLTAPIRGLYLVGANAALEIFAADKWWLEIMKNGPPAIVHHSHWVEDTGWAGGSISLQTLVPLEAGDYLQTRLYHTTPGAEAVSPMVDYSPHFWIVYLGPYPA